MEFIYYDLIFLFLFGIFVAVFLYKTRDKLKREMKIAFLYRTKLGIGFINYVGENYRKTLGVLKYISISVGYVLMGTVLFLMSRMVYTYVKYPQITRLIKAPPLAPVIPYFPKLFGMETFFPPFYFTYFIVSIAVVATVHEFAHGIFAKYHKIKIKSTGVAFFGPLLGAFVEPDEKQMDKKSKSAQLSILSAGVFANIIFAGIFLLLWAGIFYSSFVPSGAVFDLYSSSVVNISSISMINGIIVNNATNQSIIELIANSENVFNENLTKIIADDRSYLVEIENLKEQLEGRDDSVELYDDLPAINAGLEGDIIKVDGTPITTYKDLSEVMPNYSPKDEINIKTMYEGEVLEYDITLGEDPRQEGRAVLGVGNSVSSLLRIENRFAFFKEPFTRYEIKWEIALFLYYLVFWLFLINLLVAFFNMLPFAVMDGGKFFFLTIWGLTGNEKIGKAAYKWVGILILLSFALLMITWFFRIL